MHKTPIASFILLVLLSTNDKTAYAQDPEFSQPYANPLYLNPAFAGTGNNQRIGLNYRLQWPNLSGDFVTYNVSYDRNIIDSNNGIGLLANMDKSGNTITSDNISLIYARQFHIKSFTISIGVQGTYLYKNIETSQLVFNNTIAPIRGFVYTTSSRQVIQTNTSAPDFSVGILGYGKYYFVGFSANHLTQPDESFAGGASPLPLKYTANAGIMLPIGNVIISPTLLYIRQQDFDQKEMECYFTFWHLTAGIGCRWQDAVIFMLGYQGKLLRIGYSYDYTISNPTNAETGGTHEVSLALLLHYKSLKLKKVNGINCPAF